MLPIRDVLLTATNNWKPLAHPKATLHSAFQLVRLLLTT
jgi:hypothetical protein